MVLAARLHQHGDPATAALLEDLTSPAPGPGDAQVRMRLAPINPADLNVIEGSYGQLPTLPATLGNEGLGEVIAVGPGTTLAVGDLVRPMDGVGSWCRELTTCADRLLRLPSGLPDAQAAMLAVNPATAWSILAEFGPVPAGAWIALNAPGSGVGLALLALARARGLRVAALVRRADAVAGIQAAGAALVAVEGRDAHRTLRAGMDAPAVLALNQVGGDSAVTLAKLLGPRSTLVTIGALARAPLSLPNSAVIFNELRCVGFWVSRWYRRADPAQVAAMLAELATLMRAGQLLLPVDSIVPLSRLPDAIARSRDPARRGKVLLDCQA